MGDTTSNTTIDNSNSPGSMEELSGKVMVAAIIVLFLVVLFVLFLHLYAKWFWSRRGIEARVLHRSRRRFVFAPGENPLVALHRGLEPSVIRALPVVIFHTSDFKEGLECAVCLSEVEDGEKARLLPKCNHGFHLDCIDMWFQSHSTCPLCRDTVGVESSKDSIPEAQSLESGISIDSPDFPTNVLFWGNQSLVRARSIGVEETTVNSTSSVPISSQDSSLVIEIPTTLTDGFSSLSPSASRFAEEEIKSPVTPMSMRLRSLRRLLSREKRVIPSSPSSVDVEGQSSKTSSES